jgi:hypothetical protein
MTYIKVKYGQIQTILKILNVKGNSSLNETEKNFQGSYGKIYYVKLIHINIAIKQVKLMKG